MGGAALLAACNMPAVLNEDTQPGTRIGERNLGAEPSPQPTVTLSPDLKIEGDTPEEMLKNFFEQVLGVTPIDVNGTLQFRRLTDGSVLHVDGFDSQECIEGYDIDRVNIYLKGAACGAPTQTFESTPTKGQSNPEPTRTKKDNPPPEATNTPLRATVTQGAGQPVQFTPTDGGSGEHPFNTPQVSTPRAATEQPMPTEPPKVEPSNTPLVQ